MNKGNVVVTGGLGFIGSNVVKELIGRGEKVSVIYTDGDVDNWRYLRGLPIQDFIHCQDIPCLDRARAVIHLGAISSTTCTDSKALIENNFTFSKILADHCQNWGVRFIYASSAAVYGAATNKTTEDLNLEPLNLYAQTKLWLDTALIDYQNVFGLRYFNVFGKNELHKGNQSSVIPRFLKQLKTEGRVKLFIEENGRERGSATRDFISVKDVAKITSTLALNGDFQHQGNHIIDVGTGKPMSFLQVAQLVADACNVPFDVEWIPMPKDIANQYQYYTKACTSKLGDMGLYHAMFPDIFIQDYVGDLLYDPSFDISS